jgi:hypothetical protein
VMGKNGDVSDAQPMHKMLTMSADDGSTLRTALDSLPPGTVCC